jgi:hypothetical protein
MNKNPIEAISSRAEHDSAADTDSHSTFWQGAPSLIMTGDTHGKEVPGHRTEVRSRWTAANLYFLFLCPYEELHLKPHPVLTAKTNGLWNWDVAEVFIGSLRDPIQKYKEFELSPQGEWLDLDIDLDLEIPGKVAVASWSSGFEVAARIEPKKKIWYGFMRIPYGSIEDGRAMAGNLLRINFFRSQGPKLVAIAWQAPLHASFHAPEQFGLLRLVP